MDGEETIREATAREAKEEIDITILLEDLDVLHVMHRNEGSERIDFFLTTESWKGEITNAEPQFCSQLKWFPIDDLPKNTVPYIRQAIEQTQQKRIYSEFAWE